MAMAVIERVPERWSDRGKIDEKGRERQSGRSRNCHSARLINALLDSAAPRLRQRTVEIQFRPVTFVLENVMFIKYGTQAQGFFCSVNNAYSCCIMNVNFISKVRNHHSA